MKSTWQHRPFYGGTREADFTKTSCMFPWQNLNHLTAEFNAILSGTFWQSDILWLFLDTQAFWAQNCLGSYQKLVNTWVLIFIWWKSNTLVVIEKGTTFWQNVMECTWAEAAAHQIQSLDEQLTHVSYVTIMTPHIRQPHLSAVTVTFWHIWTLLSHSVICWLGSFPPCSGLGKHLADLTTIPEQAAVPFI